MRTTNRSVRMPDDIWAALEYEAKGLGVSVSWLINKKLRDVVTPVGLVVTENGPVQREERYLVPKHAARHISVIE